MTGMFRCNWLAFGVFPSDIATCVSVNKFEWTRKLRWIVLCDSHNKNQLFKQIFFCNSFKNKLMSTETWKLAMNMLIQFWTIYFWDWYFKSLLWVDGRCGWQQLLSPVLLKCFNIEILLLIVFTICFCQRYVPSPNRSQQSWKAAIALMWHKQ